MEMVLSSLVRRHISTLARYLLESRCASRGLQVPMLECQQCQHDVICSFTILEKYQRFWLDLDQDVLFSSGLCQSLREISQRWGATLGGNVGVRTIYERLNQIKPVVAQGHHEPN